MNFKVWMKSRVADKVLAPVRDELLGLIENDSSILEVGCGTGDLLFRAAPIISEGLGIDLDKDMINFAESLRLKRNLNHLHFECKDALDINQIKYDISTSTLCLHEMNETNACRVLQKMVEISKKVLIADYSKAKTLSGKIGTEADELFSGHYGNFKKYCQKGEIPSYAAQIGATITESVDSVVDGITIWVIEGKMTD